MPEGPEVRKNALFINREVSASKIQSADVKSGRYIKKPIADLKTLVGQTISEVSSKGKLIYFSLEDDRYIHSTLGMAGWWGLMPTKYARITIFARKPIFFNDMRNFGTLRVVSKDEHIKKLNLFGHDYSKNWNISEAVALTISRLAQHGKKMCIAEAMLDQRIFCGIGNYLRADSLYLAKINPHRKILDLSNGEILRIIDKTLIVSRAAWLDKSPLGRKSDYHNLVYGQQRSPSGNVVKADKLNGRTIWWSPSEQV